MGAHIVAYLHSHKRIVLTTNAVMHASNDFQPHSVHSPLTFCLLRPGWRTLC